VKPTQEPVDTKKESKESKEKKKQFDLFNDDLKQASKKQPSPPTTTNKNTTKRPAPMAPVKQKKATKRSKTEKLADRLNQV